MSDDSLTTHFERPGPSLAGRLRAGCLRLAGRLALPAALLGVALALAEGVARGVWRSVGGPTKLKAYAEALASLRAYRFYPGPGLVLPVPGGVVVHHGRGFTDLYTANDALGMGFGSFDGGLDRRPVRAVAIGDCSTRGDGSLDAASQGWAALVEKRLDWLDLVNLGDAGAGNLQQTTFYGRLAPAVEHGWVVLDFHASDDFTDNGQPFDWNQALAGLPAGEDPNAVLAGIQESLVFQRGYDFMLRSPVRSAAVWAGLAWAQGALGGDAVPPGVRAWKARYARLREEARDPRLPDEARRLADANLGAPRFVPRAEGRPFDMRLLPFHGDPAQAARLARHSAGLINAFHAALRREGRRLVLVVHPAMPEVYLRRKDWTLLRADMGLARGLLKASLDKDLPVLDLAGPLRKAARETPAPLYWFEDGAYNPEGHAVVAQAVAAFLSKTIPR